jgi:hypothetical protein
MSYTPYIEEPQYPDDTNQKYMVLPSNSSGMSEITLVTQTSPQIVFDKIAHRFGGETFDRSKQCWVERSDLRLMNERGINSVMTDVESTINFIWSNFQSDDEVMRIVNRLGKTVSRKIAMNWKEFGIEKSNLSSIVMFVCYQVLAATRRGYMSNEKEFIKKNVVEHHQTQQQVSNPRGGNTMDRKHFWEVWKK